MFPLYNFRADVLHGPPQADFARKTVPCVPSHDVAMVN